MSTETTTLAPGTFCWVDLFTSDTDAAKKFYGTLFNWQSADLPMGEGAAYTMFTRGGKPAAGLSPLKAEMRQIGVPPHWASYVQVASTDECAKKAVALGGKLLKESFDVMDMGRIAVVQDPTGATFALWQPLKPGEAAVYNQPGTLCWNELLTTDTKAAGTFYAKLFDWGSQEKNFGPHTYTVFDVKGRENAGMMTLPEEARKMGTPPNWMVYFAVSDCDATIKHATVLGAMVLRPASDIPTVGRFAVLADPQGAVFAVIRLGPR